MSTSPPSAGASSCTSAAAAPSIATVAGARLPALLMSRGLALQLRYELFNSGGWATTPSRLPHCVPLAFVALLDGLRWRHLLHTRKISHQKVNSYDGYLTTLVKTSYLLRRGP
jgi:hypothetical protein